jgi:tellurite resistance protein
MGDRRHAGCGCPEGLRGLGDPDRLRRCTEAAKAKARAPRAPVSAEEEAAASALFGFLGAAFLVAAADGCVSEAETRRFTDVLSVLSGGVLSAPTIEDATDDWAALLAEDGYEQSLAGLGDVLVDGEDRRLAYEIACGVAFADGAPSCEEDAVLADLARTLALREGDVASIRAEVERAVAAE